jgi:hypothetical protein
LPSISPVRTTALVERRMRQVDSRRLLHGDPARLKPAELVRTINLGGQYGAAVLVPLGCGRLSAGADKVGGTSVAFAYAVRYGSGEYPGDRGRSGR